MSELLEELCLATGKIILRKFNGGCSGKIIRKQFVVMYAHMYF